MISDGWGRIRLYPSLHQQHFKPGKRCFLQQHSYRLVALPVSTISSLSFQSPIVIVLYYNISLGECFDMYCKACEEHAHGDVKFLAFIKYLLLWKRNKFTKVWAWSLQKKYMQTSLSYLLFEWIHQKCPENCCTATALMEIFILLDSCISNTAIPLIASPRNKIL